MSADTPAEDIAPEPGVYNVSETVYRSWERFGFANQTWLKTFLRSKAHAKYARTQPSAPSKAMELGTGVHAAVLEPDRFERDFVCGIKVDRRTKAGKADWAAFLAANDGKEILSSDDYERAVGMRDACWNDPLVSSLLKGPGQNEVSVVWDDLKTGIRCMARVDRICGHGGHHWAFDLKTAKDASPEGFQKDIGNYLYHFQAAFYLDGLNAVSPGYRRFGFIVPEKTPPYVPAVYELCADDLDQGRREYEDMMQLLKEARKSDEWPGYASEIKPIELPRWRQRGRDVL